MDKKCLILALMLVLIVFLSTTIVSAENITDTKLQLKLPILMIKFKQK